ncbi:hypothetical protein CDAR_190711 [Caerostris darwini]|uniref:Uncharacterized protein n=1 Tax=Caerostris darwini TaxID=1538125 RepID=A0AAV4NF85_9ARAC|nr:hypothetical protein CDAR_190711 [Caerostris darwini]
MATGKRVTDVEVGASVTSSFRNFLGNHDSLQNTQQQPFPIIPELILHDISEKSVIPNFTYLNTVNNGRSQLDPPLKIINQFYLQFLSRYCAQIANRCKKNY